MSTTSRRDLIRAAAALAAAAAVPADIRRALAREVPASPFSFEALVVRARDMAAGAYVPPPRPMPEVVERIDYDAHGRIRFRADAAPYADGKGAYPVTFFHLGRYFGRPVKIFLVDGGQAREFEYSPTLFDMPVDSPARELPYATGFAGFRFQESSGAQDWRTQDWLAFLGASYFRAIGGLGQYGLSARGVLIDAAVDGPEEFPDFREFYIEQSTDPAAPVIVHALLDGPSVSGAFRFSIIRGLDRSKGVVMDIDAQLFMRRDVRRLGLIPLTSMFWYGEYGRERVRDWRPEVHDSDGLAIWTGAGERIWRPLNNPPSTRVSAFLDENPRGFGLLQRDRDFGNYLDGVMYDRRPSLWVEPLRPLGAGAVELLEIPTDDEIHDNIGAFWVPRAAARAGDSYDLSYRLHWVHDEPFPATNVAQTIATRMGRGGDPGTARPQNVYRITVEFDRPSVMTQIPYGVFPKVVVSTTAGRIGRSFAEPVPNGNVWRAAFDLEIAADQIAELRLYLELDGKPLTETWLQQFDLRSMVPV